MRAKFVNEKFTDESDPIKDMNIGLKSTLTKYQLDNMLDIIRIKDNDLDKIQAFFGPLLKDIYWLGDTSINVQKDKYFKHIRDIIEKKTINKKPHFSADFILRKMGKYIHNVITTYNTTDGKIATQIYRDGGNTETTYFGDINMAFNVQVVQNKIFSDL